MKSDWILPDIDCKEVESLSGITGIDKNIVSILFSRGIKDKEDIRKFIYPELGDLHSPFLLDGIFDAVSRLKRAVKETEKIAVFGDSDLDGITSMTIIFGVLEKCGCKPMIRYPKAKESYGLTVEIIDEFIANDIKLVITVDSGIRDIDEINYGKTHGIDFIVTDHHEPGDTYPDAIIINPKKNECCYPYKELAGVGVIFKLTQAFLYSYTSSFNTDYVLVYKDKNFLKITKIKNGIIIGSHSCKNEEIVAVISSEIKSDDYVIFLNEAGTTLAPIVRSIHPTINVNDFLRIASSVTGTVFENEQVMFKKLISDYNMVSFKNSDEFTLYTKLFIELHWRGFSRIMTILQEYMVLVTIGTIADVMPLTGENRQMVKLGLSVINSGDGHAGILSIAGDTKITTKVVSWDIAPLLNAPGRMGETDLTVNFFLEKDISKIDELINSIQKINRDRKKTVNEIIDKIKNYEDTVSLNDNIFFYKDDEIIDGLAGLIANRISDDLNKPAVIVTGADRNGIVKGSARSSANFDFFSFTAQITDLFDRIGGHAQAFGFTAKEGNIKSIIEEINSAVGNGYIPEKKINIDLKININEINPQYIKNLSMLEPFGKSNDEPLFVSEKIKIMSFSPFGNRKNHGRFVINDSMHVIGWNMCSTMENYFKAGKEVDLVFKLENNEYQGRVYPRMVLLDIDFSV